MEATKSQTMRKFTGINNADTQTRLAPVVIDNEYAYPLRQASNVEIDNTLAISSRSGYTKKVTGTNIHSLWSDGVCCFYVDGATLYQLFEDYTTLSLRTDMHRNARVSYTKFNDRYYYTNEYQIGYAKNGVSYSVMDPVKNFKLPLPAGQCIDHYMGCLYLAKGKTLYISDPLCDYYDTRVAYRQFVERITMVRAVDDGVYVSADKVYYLRGKANEDFVSEDPYPVRAIPHTDVRISGKYINDKVAGNVAVWTAENGICIGDNKGIVVNMTEERYILSGYGRGTGFLRENDNKRFYINSLY